MGYSRMEDTAYRTYATEASLRDDGTAKSIHETFQERKIHTDLDPKLINIRESRDSDVNPRSTPIMFGLDVTGSMGMIPHYMIKTGLGDMLGKILSAFPAMDPQVMLLGIGDAACDHAPLQASQFESGLEMAEQLSKLYLEGNGGGNNTESYDLPWYFAAKHTSTDSWEKRKKKGYLFTIGDELPPSEVLASNFKRIFGSDSQVSTMSSKEMLKMAEETFDVFHIIALQGSYARNHSGVTSAWRSFMGTHVLPLTDYKLLDELVVAVIKVNEGATPEEVIQESQSAEVKAMLKVAFNS